MEEEFLDGLMVSLMMENERMESSMEMDGFMPQRRKVERGSGKMEKGLDGFDLGMYKFLILISFFAPSCYTWKWGFL